MVKCKQLFLPHLGPRDDDPDKADVVGAHAVQTLVDALRKKLATVVARLDYNRNRTKDQL